MIALDIHDIDIISNLLMNLVKFLVSTTSFGNEFHSVITRILKGISFYQFRLAHLLIAVNALLFLFPEPGWKPLTCFPCAVLNDNINL